MIESSVKPGQWGAPFNFADWTDYLTFDIMGDLSFGVQLNTKEPGENRFRQIPYAIHKYMRFQYPVSTSTTVQTIQKLLILLTIP